MTPRMLFVCVLCVCLFNGLTSPLLLLMQVLAPIWMPGFLPSTPELQFYFASLLVSFGTLLLAGVPAALYERLRRQRSSDRTSLLVWLGAAILLTLPGFQLFLRATAA